MGHKDKGTRNYNPSLAAQQTKQGKSYLARIRKMEPYERLLYWIRERHAIHIHRFPKGFYAQHPANVPPPKISPTKRGAGHYVPPKEEPPPWTEDPIFQTVFFCNVYRENDKVTAYQRDNFREANRSKPCALLGNIMLRWYNYIPTMARLINAGIPQAMGSKKAGSSIDHAAEMLIDLRDNYKEQLFGGAYIIRPIVDGKSGARKVESLAELFHKLNEDYKYLNNEMVGGTMEGAYNLLRQYSGMGSFYCYQFIGDLAYTDILADASDWFTWSFCGPGTARGLLRLQHPTGSLTRDDLPRMMKAPRDAQEQLEELQIRVNRDLCGRNPKATKNTGGEVRKLIPLHMRDLTNCLCEYDKYERSLFNERSIKRPYHGQG